MNDRASHFWSKVKLGLPDECWPWLGGRKNGYGKFYWEGREFYAHRVAFELDRGFVPENRVLHGCDFRLCCNPRCLHEGTHDDNMREMRERGRSAGRERHSQAKLTEDPVREIRRIRASEGLSQSAIAGRFGVSRSCVEFILSGKHWPERED